VPTKLQLIEDALSHAGIFAPGETIPAADADSCSRNFDSFVDRLNATRQAIFSETILNVALVPGQQTRTIGPGGDINTTRPQQITAANLIFSPSTSSEVRRPLDLWVEQQWSQLRFQNVQGPPLRMYQQTGYPLWTLYFYPIPDQAYGLELYVWNQLAIGTPLSSTVIFPPGYQDMLTFNLARRFCGLFDRPISSYLEQQATQSMMDAFGNNSVSPLLSTEQEISPRRGGYYNYHTGQVEP
jgi:hypothetical protein